MTRSKDLSPQALAAWRLLRDEGGYWTAGEVGRRVMPNAEPDMAARLAGRWLLALRRRECVVVNPLAVRVQAYGVTSRCSVPPGEAMSGGDQ